MQSRGVHLPDVEVVAGFAEAAALDGAAMADRDGEPLTLRHPTVLVGPEGGWSDAERGSLVRVGLSDQVLRAETAAVTAGVLLSALRSELIENPQVRNHLARFSPESEQRRRLNA